MISLDFVTSLRLEFYRQSDATDFESKWHRWFEEVDRLEPEPSTTEPDEYGKLLIEKYRPKDAFLTLPGLKTRGFQHFSYNLWKNTTTI